MPTYSYACTRCGPFSLFRPMSQSSLPGDCPTCDEQSRRSYEVPHLSELNPSLDRAVAQSERSAEAPQVTRSIPPARGVTGTGRVAMR
ncbi:putative regulatory protein, FmdB family [Brevibacterium siliguriense]|uniref:Putative regulatory protein, FmdB family n=1 Tax=Brevibacterium siliguriense TaxID=1136497 RepID=A0A1H1LLB5_9MICO|nr:putative regulatory protein, FmdB family [Brevibacterium siliguriense]